MTGVEPVSNGVPHFQPPKSRNAASTLASMGGLTIAMFAGITALALVSHVRFADDPAQLVGAPVGYQQRTAIAQVAGAVFGYGVTPFLEAAQAAGCKTANGDHMVEAAQDLMVEFMLQA